MALWNVNKKKTEQVWNWILYTSIGGRNSQYLIQKKCVLQCLTLSRLKYQWQKFHVPTATCSPNLDEIMIKKLCLYVLFIHEESTSPQDGYLCWQYLWGWLWCWVASSTNTNATGQPAPANPNNRTKCIWNMICIAINVNSSQLT